MMRFPRPDMEETEAFGREFYGPNWSHPHLPPRPFAKLSKEHIDWLLKQGVTIDGIQLPNPMRLTYGYKSQIDGRLERNSWGLEWFVFPQAEDAVFWRLETGELATLHGRAFALGEHVFLDAETFTSDRPLKIFADPLQWLKAGRDGIVVIDWASAFETLLYVPRIAIEEALVQIVLENMGPNKTPIVFNRVTGEAAA